MSNQRRQWQPTPVLLPGKSHGRRRLVGCSPWGHWGSDTTEQLHFHFSLSCIGDGNGNPPQCSCFENPRDRGAWWARSLGSHSQTGLKQLSSSNSSSLKSFLFFLGFLLLQDSYCKYFYFVLFEWSEWTIKYSKRKGIKWRNEEKFGWTPGPL